MPGEKTQMKPSALSKRATAIAIILGLLLALPMTELILHVTYNSSGITNGPWRTHPKGAASFFIQWHTVAYGVVLSRVWCEPFLMVV